MTDEDKTLADLTTVDAYGLQIGLDAMDEATEVRFPRGATARWEA